MGNPMFFTDPDGMMASANDPQMAFNGMAEVIGGSMAGGDYEAAGAPTSYGDDLQTQVLDGESVRNGDESGGSPPDEGDKKPSLIQRVLSWLTGGGNKKQENNMVVGPIEGNVIGEDLISATHTAIVGNQSVRESPLGDQATLKLFQSTTIGSKKFFNIDYSTMNAKEEPLTYQFGNQYELSLQGGGAQAMINIAEGKVGLGLSIGKEGFGMHYQTNTAQSNSVSRSSGGSLHFRPGGGFVLTTAALLAPPVYVAIPILTTTTRYAPYLIPAF